MRRYAKEIVWVGIAQAAAFAGGLATVKTAAIMLGPAEYGKLATALAVVGVCQVCLYGAISQTATRFYAVARADHVEKVYQASLIRLVALAAGVVIALWILASVFGVSDWLPVSAAMLSAYAIVSGIQAILVAVCNGARKRELVAAVQMAEATLRPLLIIVLSYLMVRTAQNIFLAYFFCAVLLVGAILLVWTSRSRFDTVSESDVDDQKLFKSSHLSSSMMAYAAPFVAFGLLGVLGSHGERLLLTKWVEWTDVGSYVLMAQLAMAPNVLFASVINQFYLPIVFQFDPGGSRKISRSFRLYVLFSVLGTTGITIVISVLGYRLIPILSSAAFLGHEHLLWFLGLSAGLFCIAQQLVLPGLRLNRPSIYMPGKLIHSLVLLGMAILLVPRWGIDGMGVASLVSSAAYLSAIMLANVGLTKSVNPSE